MGVCIRHGGVSELRHGGVVIRLCVCLCEREREREGRGEGDVRVHALNKDAYVKR